MSAPRLNSPQVIKKSNKNKKIAVHDSNEESSDFILSMDNKPNKDLEDIYSPRINK